MLNFYRHYVTLYHNGKKIKTENCGDLIAENAPEDFTETITWENVSEKYSENGFIFFFNIWNFRRGRRISFFSDDFIKDIKEWKEELNLTVVHEYLMFNPSINYVLNFPNSEKAIKYLIERGLAIAGK